MAKAQDDPPQRVEVLLIQLCNDSISHMDDASCEVTVERAEWTQISVVLYEREVEKKTWEELNKPDLADKAFETLIHKHVGKRYLDPRSTLRITKGSHQQKKNGGQLSGDSSKSKRKRPQRSYASPKPTAC